MSDESVATFVKLHQLVSATRVRSLKQAGSASDELPSPRINTASVPLYRSSAVVTAICNPQTCTIRAFVTKSSMRHQQHEVQEAVPDLGKPGKVSTVRIEAVFGIHAF